MAGHFHTRRIVHLLSLGPRPMPLTCARKFTSSAAVAQRKRRRAPRTITGLENTPTFTAPEPDDSTVDEFLHGRSNEQNLKLPGTRYQYHPPKYFRGPLHPMQSPPSSDPVARDFVPGPFNLPRLRETYDTTVAPDLLTLTYKHIPPGSPPSQSAKGMLRKWDDSSPYHKGRTRRAPRGGAPRLLPLEQDIEYDHIPKIWGVSISMHTPECIKDKEYAHVARAVLQAITGSYCKVSSVRTDVGAWNIREGTKAGYYTSIKGAAAYEFVDKLMTLVLPKIKDWRGIKATTGDGAGNLSLGMKPEWMAFFPELEYNYAMYPESMIRGCNIFIKTTATSDKHAKLLLQALGLPFYHKRSLRKT